MFYRKFWKYKFLLHIHKIYFVPISQKKIWLTIQNMRMHTTPTPTHKQYVSWNQNDMSIIEIKWLINKYIRDLKVLTKRKSTIEKVL